MHGATPNGALPERDGRPDPRRVIPPENRAWRRTRTGAGEFHEGSHALIGRAATIAYSSEHNGCLGGSYRIGICEVCSSAPTNNTQVL
jgi:hypothetical protein